MCSAATPLWACAEQGLFHRVGYTAGKLKPASKSELISPYSGLAQDMAYGPDHSLFLMDYQPGGGAGGGVCEYVCVCTSLCVCVCVAKPSSPSFQSPGQTSAQRQGSVSGLSGFSEQTSVQYSVGLGTGQEPVFWLNITKERPFCEVRTREGVSFLLSAPLSSTPWVPGSPAATGCDGLSSPEPLRCVNW